MSKGASLLRRTKNPKYWNAVQKVMETVFQNRPEDGLVPVFIDPTSGEFRGEAVRLGSRGDSYYGNLFH